MLAMQRSPDCKRIILTKKKKAIRVGTKYSKRHFIVIKLAKASNFCPKLMKLKQCIVLTESQTRIESTKKGALVKIEPTHPKYVIRCLKSKEQVPLYNATSYHTRDRA